MNLPYRIDLLSRLGDYMLSYEDAWIEAKEKASQENGWFVPEFLEFACTQIAKNYLNKDALVAWMQQYNNMSTETETATVGLVTAGNIPLVGFHDWLCIFITGNKALVKPSSKDKILLQHLTDQIAAWSAEAAPFTEYSEMLKGCDAYIATGSNNSSRYFEFYFGKYTHIIRRNRTSVAVLSGKETIDELSRLADDVYLYFGRGCRNVTKLFVPEGYDFVPLLEAFRKYSWVADHHKYKNNYDYNLALALLNKKFYMTNGSILLLEESSVFSPISQVNYEFYNPTFGPPDLFGLKNELQCVVGQGFLSFGETQHPALSDYADGVDTVQFLTGLKG